MVHPTWGQKYSDEEDEGDGNIFHKKWIQSNDGEAYASFTGKTNVSKDQNTELSAT